MLIDFEKFKKEIKDQNFKPFAEFAVFEAIKHAEIKTDLATEEINILQSTGFDEHYEQTKEELKCNLYPIDFGTKLTKTTA